MLSTATRTSGLWPQGPWCPWLPYSHSDALYLSLLLTKQLLPQALCTCHCLVCSLISGAQPLWGTHHGNTAPYLYICNRLHLHHGPFQAPLFCCWWWWWFSVCLSHQAPPEMGAGTSFVLHSEHLLSEWAPTPGLKAWPCWLAALWQGTGHLSLCLSMMQRGQGLSWPGEEDTVVPSAWDLATHTQSPTWPTHSCNHPFRLPRAHTLPGPLPPGRHLPRTLQCTPGNDSSQGRGRDFHDTDMMTLGSCGVQSPPPLPEADAQSRAP